MCQHTELPDVPFHFRSPSLTLPTRPSPSSSHQVPRTATAASSVPIHPLPRSEQEHWCVLPRHIPRFDSSTEHSSTSFDPPTEHTDSIRQRSILPCPAFVPLTSQIHLAMRVPAIRLSVGDPGARRGQSTHSTATFNFDGAVLAPASTSALEVAYPLLPAPSGAPSDAVELRVGEMVMYGEVWDVFAATLNLPPGPSDSPTGDGLAVVVKLCALSDYAPVPRIARDGGTTRAHVETCIATELDIYVHELSSLAVVPELYGAFVGSVSDGGEEVRVWAVVLEDVGLSMVPEDLDTCPELEYVPAEMI